MSTGILFINPIGTDMYDEYTLDLIGPAAADSTNLEVRSLDNLPKTPFMPPLPLLRDELFASVVAAEREGFDAVVVACTADPWVREVKEAVDIPVTGPFEAMAHTAPSLGPLSIIASGYKIETWKPRAFAHGLEDNLSSVRMADFSHPSQEVTEKLFAEDVGALRELVMTEMVRAVDDDGVEQSQLAADEDDAASVFFACTFWSGLLDPVAEGVPGVTVLDPLVMPLRYAEYLAAVHHAGGLPPAAPAPTPAPAP